MVVDFIEKRKRLCFSAGFLIPSGSEELNKDTASCFALVKVLLSLLLCPIQLQHNVSFFLGVPYPPRR